jgi:hypothetical protein
MRDYKQDQNKVRLGYQPTYVDELQGSNLLSLIELIYPNLI